MLDKILRETVEKYPEKIAIVYDALRITYKELYADIVGFANGLKSIGIKPGDCIALILPNYPEFITTFFAAAKLNAIVVLINPVLAEEEIRHYVSDSDAVAIITDNQRADVCRSIILRSDRKIELIVVDGSHTSNLKFNDLIRDRSEDMGKDAIYEGEIIYQYSSGSTGRPKRVGRTHRNLYHEACNFHVTANTSDSDNIMCLVPLFHAHGLGNCMLASIYVGATLTILEDLKKDGKPVTVPFVLRRQKVLELIESEHITILPGVPFVFSALAETPDDVKVDISGLRLCFSAGNFLSKEIFDKLLKRFGIPVRQLYGCTEVGSFSLNMEPADAIHYDSVGTPMKNNEVRVVDDDGNLLPQGTVGELEIKSDALTSGYYNRPELNKEAFKGGYFLTGDLGKIDEDGRIYITGRKKIFIETGGNKVDPLEVEDVLITHPKVNEVVVVGVNGLYGGEMIKAVIVPEGECGEREIISYCKGKLTSFKIPEVIEFRDEIPKSPLGKVLRKNLI